VVFMAHTPGPIRWHYRQVLKALVERAIERLPYLSAPRRSPLAFRACRGGSGPACWSTITVWILPQTRGLVGATAGHHRLRASEGDR
jgi:hypothetical protein